MSVKLWLIKIIEASKAHGEHSDEELTRKELGLGAIVVAKCNSSSSFLCIR